MSGAGRDCCFASEGRAGGVAVGCRRCGNGGRLDSESLIAHLAALGGETARHVAAHATNDRAAIETPSPLLARAWGAPAGRRAYASARGAVGLSYDIYRPWRLSLPCCFLAGEVFPLGLCRPRYLLVTLVSGELSADGEATILDVPVGPYMFNLCGGELISMVSHADRAAILMQFGETVIKTIVRETLAELCRAMSSCAVVSDTPSQPGAA